MKSDTLSLKTIIKELDFLRKVIIQWIVWKKKKKDFLLLANKLIEKTPDLSNAKEHCQSFIRKKNTKLVKQSEIVSY